MKFFKKNPSSINNKKSYAQASSNSSNIARETLKINKAFLSFQNKKIKQVQKIISRKGKPKPCINMTIKGPLCKQVMIPMSIDNANNFVKESNIHVANINRLLKNIKLDVMANFIHIENTGMVISTNKVANPLDLQTIKKYIKNTCCIEVKQIEPLRLPQSKSYLKIIGIPNLSEQTNAHITSDEIDKILKNTHIFNDIVLASKPRVIKVSPQVQHGYCLD